MTFSPCRIRSRIGWSELSSLACNDRRSNARDKSVPKASTQRISSGAPCRICKMAARGLPWVVYAKRPFGGPAAVLAYLARYTHRVAIANSRLIALRDGAVTFKWKDYRIKGRDRQKTMTLPVAEFIRP
jgi:Putative transposase